MRSLTTNRKWLIAPIFATFLLTTLPAHAAIKSGESCSKLGKTTVQSGYKYLCVKKNGKLVWGKATKVTSPKVETTPLPTATPSPSPVPSPTLSANAPEWQKNQFGIATELQGQIPSSVQKLVFVYSPKTNIVAADKLKAAYQEPITYLSNLYVNPNQVTFFIMSESEHDWWWDQVSKLGTNMEQNWWGGKNCLPDALAHCGYGSSPKQDGTFHFGHIIGSKLKWSNTDYALASHEAIHVYQLGILGSRMQSLPFWFAEGQANYLGFAFSHKYIDSRLQRDDILLSLKRSFPELSKFSSSEWHNWLIKIDTNSDFTFSNGLGYSVGELMMEALYRDFNYKLVHEWMVEIKSGLDFKPAFTKTFGTNYDDWLRLKAATYLNGQVN